MERKLKILHANTGLVAGGAERLIADTLPKMDGEKFEVDLLILEDKNNNIFSQELVQYGIKIKKIKYNRKFDIRNILEIRKIIKHYDIVHAHIFPMQYWVPLATLGLRNKPFLITTEHSTHNSRRNFSFFKPFERYIYSFYDVITSITRETEDNLIQWIGTERSSKFSLVENGVDLDKFRNSNPINIQKLLGVGTDSMDRFILMVARFDDAKDHSTVLEAIRLTEDNVKMIFVGEGKLESQYKQMAIDLGIEKRVYFAGKHNDIPSIIKSVDICVLSSNWEGFGLAAVEAMAGGKPVIASRVPGLEKVVKGAGILFEKGNSQELANIINKLISDPILYNKIVVQQHKRADNYSIDATVRKFSDIYRKLIIGRRN
ncbi:glycosyltransferase [Rossellomorea sp. AcN35-11]|nr:glycosyltransferase [Rossellomorea aquimaris]WJV30820.1 glycosyltransferase [Rossellomorea sp. AcN35-11]